MSKILFLILGLAASAASAASLSEDTPVEVHAGDRLPFTIHVGGDLARTTQDGQVTVVAQRSFFLELHQGQVLMSYDGVSFQPMDKQVTGQLSTGIEGDPSALGGKIDLEVDAK